MIYGIVREQRSHGKVYSTILHSKLYYYQPHGYRLFFHAQPGTAPSTDPCKPLEQIKPNSIIEQTKSLFLWHRMRRRAAFSFLGPNYHWSAVGGCTETGSPEQRNRKHAAKLVEEENHSGDSNSLEKNHDQQTTSTRLVLSPIEMLGPAPTIHVSLVGTVQHEGC